MNFILIVIGLVFILCGFIKITAEVAENGHIFTMCFYIGISLMFIGLSLFGMGIPHCISIGV